MEASGQVLLSALGVWIPRIIGALLILADRLDHRETSRGHHPESIALGQAGRAGRERAGRGRRKTSEPGRRHHQDGLLPDHLHGHSGCPERAGSDADHGDVHGHAHPGIRLSAQGGLCAGAGYHRLDRGPVPQGHRDPAAAPRRGRQAGRRTGRHGAGAGLHRDRRGGLLAGVAALPADDPGGAGAGGNSGAHPGDADRSAGVPA